MNIVLAHGVGLHWDGCSYSGSLYLMGCPHLSDAAGQHGAAKVLAILIMMMLKAEVRGVATRAHYERVLLNLEDAKQGSESLMQWLWGGVHQVNLVIPRGSRSYTINISKQREKFRRQLLLSLKPLCKKVQTLQLLQGAVGGLGGEAPAAADAAAAVADAVDDSAVLDLLFRVGDSRDEGGLQEFTGEVEFGMDKTLGV